MKRLWVVEFRPSNQAVSPEPRLFPDWEAEGIEVVTADQFYAVVRADYDHLQNVLRSYPYQQLAGHPADGRWVSEGGEETYIVDGRVYEDEFEAWNALGLEPAKFDAETWDDVDPDVVRSYIPYY